jgi:ABC-2 type transport system permease protein
MLRVFRAYLFRDVSMARSYRLDFGLRLLSVLLAVVAFFYVSRVIGDKPEFAAYGGYQPFVVIGFTLMIYWQTALKGFGGAVRNEQMMGTLESVLMTPARLSTIVVGSSLWAFVGATLTAVVLNLSSALLYDFSLKGSLPLALLIMVLTTVTCACLGVISASFIMVFKRGDPLGFFIGALFTLLGGVFFPVDVLPSWLQKLSLLLPITHGNDALRSVLLLGKGFQDVLPQLVVLSVFAALGVPLSLICFKKAVFCAKRDGTLVQY